MYFGKVFNLLLIINIYFVASIAIAPYLVLELMDKSGIVNRIIAIGNMEIINKERKTSSIEGEQRSKVLAHFGPFHGCWKLSSRLFLSVLYSNFYSPITEP